jgi:hypothetical protein
VLIFLTHEDVTQLIFKAKVILRRTVIQPVCPGVRSQTGPMTNFIVLEIFLRKLRCCYFVAPSLTRGRVCNLLLLLSLASAVPLGSKSRRTQEHILLSQFLRLHHPGEPGPRIYISQGQGCPDIPLGTGVPFRRLLLFAGLRWGNSNPPPHGILTHCRSRSRSYFTTDGQPVSQPVSQSVSMSWYRAPLCSNYPIYNIWAHTANQPWPSSGSCVQGRSLATAIL